MLSERTHFLPSELDADFAERYDVERARWLRRWFLWYCAVATLVLSFSTSTNIYELLFTIDNESARASSLLDLAGDILLICLYAGAALLIALRRPDRAWLVRVMTVLIVVAATVCMLVAPLTTFIDTDAGAQWGLKGEILAFALGASGLIAMFILHFCGSLFIALTPKESVRPLLPMAAIFVLITLFINPGNLITKFILIGLFPFMGGPGVLLSWWRASRFRERFESREISGRLGEISLELAYARRIHESLFPPAIKRGPVRVEYRYEPMRQIGGDFLFVHPLAFPPVELNEPITIVLIDVSGHGVGAALAVNRLHGELTRFFFTEPNGTPGELLGALNHYAYVALAPQGVFASAFVMRVDPANGSVRWANAGHPAALLRRHDGALVELNSTAVLLGVVENAAFEPAAQSITLGANEVIVAYTDGVIETRSALTEQFGMQRLRAAVAQRFDPTVQSGQLARLISEEVRHYRHGAVTDDLLIVEVFLSHEAEAKSHNMAAETTVSHSAATDGI